jgi:predicted TPR repeat methyltransferase
MFAASANALKPGGLLVFTAEALTEGDAGFKLNPSGRYSHGRRYIEDALRASGMEIKEFSEVELRTEHKKPVAGYLVAACNSGVEI